MLVNQPRHLRSGISRLRFLNLGRPGVVAGAPGQPERGADGDGQQQPSRGAEGDGCGICAEQRADHGASGRLPRSVSGWCVTTRSTTFTIGST